MTSLNKKIRVYNCVLRQEFGAFFWFVAKECESRKKVKGNNGDYLDSARNRRNFASQLKFILALI